MKRTENLPSNRITIREFKLEDAENLFNNWGTDEEITKYMLWNNYKTIDDAINSINYYIEGYENNGTFRQHVIELNDIHELIGQISFTINKRHESAEIAHLLSRKFQRKGYMNEAINT